MKPRRITEKRGTITLLKDFFQFENKFYKQKEGWSMGSSHSPLMAEIFMNNLENNILNNSSHSPIKHWFRYVDDCFILLEGAKEDAYALLEIVNNLHSNINFSIQFEKTIVSTFWPSPSVKLKIDV